jgi:hypothetical protein
MQLVRWLIDEQWLGVRRQVPMVVDDSQCEGTFNVNESGLAVDRSRCFLRFSRVAFASRSARRRQARRPRT